MPHRPNHGTAESSSEIEGGSAGTCDVTGDYDTLIIRDCDNSVTRDSLPQVSQTCDK